MFEGDALQVVNSVNSLLPCNTGYGHLIEDIKANLHLVGLSSFKHVRRTANTVTHELALYARTHVTNMRWFSIPSCVSGIVRKEESSSLS
jgi:hypothetical protein